MATSNPSPAGQLGRTDHLTVRPEDIGPPEVHFQFEQQQQRIGNAVGVSVLPLDVPVEVEIIVEVTGHPPAAVTHALKAFAAKKHVVNVTL